MKTDQVFVRAWVRVNDNQIRIVNCDILDLDQKSFMAIITGILFRSGLLVGIKDEFCKGEEVKLYVDESNREKYLKKLDEDQ